MIKTLQRVGTEGTYLNITKVMYDKHTDNIILNSEKLKAFPLRSRPRQGCLLLPLLFSTGLEDLSGRIKEEKERGYKLETRLNCLCLQLRQYHTQYPKYAARILLELINELSKPAGHKTNTQTPPAFLYTNRRSEREIKATISFTIASKRVTPRNKPT